MPFTPSTMTSLVSNSPTITAKNRMSMPSPLMSPIEDVSSAQSHLQARANLQRRFTTNALPALAPIGEKRRQSGQDSAESTVGPAEKSQDTTKLATASQSQFQSARDARQYEDLLALQLRVQAQISMIDPDTRREVDEVKRLEQDISNYSSTILSQPSTPPVPQPALGVNSPALAVKRYSLSTIPTSSSSSIPRRQSRTSLQATAPLIDFKSPVMTNVSPSYSGVNPDLSHDTVSGENDLHHDFTASHAKSGANVNRNSMPVIPSDLRSQSTAMSGLPYHGSFVNRGFNFGDKDNDLVRSPMRSAGPTSPDAKTFLQLHETDDKFPILVRRETDKGSQFSASTILSDQIPAALSPDGIVSTDRTMAVRHRQSLPPGVIGAPNATTVDMPPSNPSTISVAARSSGVSRPSLEVQLSGLGHARHSLAQPTADVDGPPGMPKLLSSYSTNDIPTIKDNAAISSAQANELQAFAMPPLQSFSQTSSAAAQPMTPVVNSQPGTVSRAEEQMRPVQHRPPPPPMQSANASAEFALPNTLTPSPYAMHVSNARPYGSYDMQMLNHAFSGTTIGQLATPWTSAPAYSQPQAYPANMGGYQPMPFAQTNQPRGTDMVSRVSEYRREYGQEDKLRYADIPVGHLTGEIYGLCKDQHGCRYLQKKLQERNPEQFELVFNEIAPHIVELMTDPFGNYLCQKLLEYATNEQRVAMIKRASPQMIKIALNQHGTRALQKMVESVTTKQQIGLIIDALRNNVVQLIQDLNGNHVIQKCLNHLERNDAQFIYDAVCLHVVSVGTHRHGCCVLQRCIDHASGLQKGQIVAAVAQSAFLLMQDPFGNYVVQYILDLQEPVFSEPLCHSFLGHISTLSRQKFSSNVIEKAIRIANADTRRVMIEEMLHPIELEKMLRDSFANYVIQTAIEYADPITKGHLLNTIRPLLPAIRHTPHGRRLQNKLQEAEGRFNGYSSGLVSPTEMSNPSHGLFPPSLDMGRPQQAFTDFNVYPPFQAAYKQGGQNAPRNPGFPYNPRGPQPGHYQGPSQPGNPTGRY